MNRRNQLALLRLQALHFFLPSMRYPHLKWRDGDGDGDEGRNGCL